jgi:hypothetical protein
VSEVGILFDMPSHSVPRGGDRRRKGKLGHWPAMMIPTLDPLVSASGVAKVLSFAKRYLKPFRRGDQVSQKCLAKVGNFARIFAT